MLVLNPHNFSLRYNSGPNENHFHLVAYIIGQDGRSPMVPERLQNFSGSQLERVSVTNVDDKIPEMQAIDPHCGTFSHQQFIMTCTKRLRPFQRTYPARPFFITGASTSIGVAVAVALARADASFIDLGAQRLTCQPPKRDIRTQIHLY